APDVTLRGHAVLLPLPLPRRRVPGSCGARWLGLRSPDLRFLHPRRLPAAVRGEPERGARGGHPQGGRGGLGQDVGVPWLARVLVRRGPRAWRAPVREALLGPDTGLLRGRADARGQGARRSCAARR